VAQDAPPTVGNATDVHSSPADANPPAQFLSLPESFVLTSSTAEAEWAPTRSNLEVGELKPVEYAGSATNGSQLAHAEYAMPDLHAPPQAAEALRAALGLPPSTDIHTDIDHPHTIWATPPDLHSARADTGETGEPSRPLSDDITSHHLEPQFTSAHHVFEEVNFTSWHSH
jgi:hypothetical protein